MARPRAGGAISRSITVTKREIASRDPPGGVLGGSHLPETFSDRPRPCPNDVYEQRMTEAMDAARQAGTDHLVFGDLFLGDVRSYREQSLEGTGITPLFPPWGRPTVELAADMIAQGLREVITCVDPAQAPAELAGRWYDEELLRGLPAGVDPCGERGEFHTFVVDGPGFATSLDVVVGEITERDGFVFADLLPA